MTVAAAPDLLATIVAATQRIVHVRSHETPFAALEQLCRHMRRRPDGRAFERAVGESPAPRVIAECKRRSPSRGILRTDYDAAAHARAYQSAGAAAVSVLTEPTFFDGAPDHLRAVREATDLPILRKDFIVSEYQLLEAVALGADAVLLIVSALDDAALRGMLQRAHELDLACLVEVHDRDEVARAVDAGARMIGVNSRNLRTLSVDPGVFGAVAAMLPPGIRSVAESGITSREDIDRLSTIGYDAFLVGERLMRQPDPGAALSELRERLRPERGAGGEPAEGRPPGESERGRGPASIKKC
jgi:indole-3-glycerol phosphate synthase